MIFPHFWDIVLAQNVIFIGRHFFSITILNTTRKTPILNQTCQTVVLLTKAQYQFNIVLQAFEFSHSLTFRYSLRLCIPSHKHNLPHDRSPAKSKLPWTQENSLKGIQNMSTFSIFNQINFSYFIPDLASFKGYVTFWLFRVCFCYNRK